MTVISLSDKRQETQPHAAGEAICLSYKHSWVAVRPVERNEPWMECPSCSRMMGRYRFSFIHHTNKHWECKCGNDLFHILPLGAFCPSCGEEQRF